MATTGRIWAESQKILLVVGGIRTGNLAISNVVVYPLSQAPTPRKLAYLHDSLVALT